MCSMLTVQLVQLMATAMLMVTQDRVRRQLRLQRPSIRRPAMMDTNMLDAPLPMATAEEATTITRMVTWPVKDCTNRLSSPVAFASAQHK